MAKIDGEFYNAYATWDDDKKTDKDNIISNLYFMLPDYMLLGKR